MKGHVLLCSLLTGMAAAAQPVIEPDATIGSGIDGKLLILGAQRVQASGYRCDSISSMQRWWAERGFTLGCNDGRYRYEIVERDGNWVVRSAD